MRVKVRPALLSFSLARRRAQLKNPSMFPPGTRVQFRTTIGTCLGTVIAMLDDCIDGDHVHRVKPDDGAFGVMLLLGRSMESVEDVPFVVTT
jgi:hypothetical protein